MSKEINLSLDNDNYLKHNILFFIILFLFIPYLVGCIFIVIGIIDINHISISNLLFSDGYSFVINWLIGYELISIFTIIYLSLDLFNKYRKKVS